MYICRKYHFHENLNKNLELEHMKNLEKYEEA